LIRLHVNIDHVATLRNARGTAYPDPVFAAELCEQAGADGITLHLREDRRHIRDADVERVRAAIHTLMNLEMAATAEMMAIAERIRPDVVTLVPERREERTTEGGLAVVSQRETIEKIAEMCVRKAIKLSLFIAPDPAEPRISPRVARSEPLRSSSTPANIVTRVERNAKGSSSACGSEPSARPSSASKSPRDMVSRATT
jgi:pyridoxine 5-phosphate synthase